MRAQAHAVFRVCIALIWVACSGIYQVRELMCIYLPAWWASQIRLVYPSFFLLFAGLCLFEQQPTFHNSLYKQKHKMFSRHNQTIEYELSYAFL